MRHTGKNSFHGRDLSVKNIIRHNLKSTGACMTVSLWSLNSSQTSLILQTRKDDNVSGIKFSR